MKKSRTIIVFSLLLLLFAGVAACESEDETIGRTAEFKVDKTTIDMPAEGGSDTIHITDDGMFVIYDVYYNLEGEAEFMKHDAPDNCLYQKDWFKIEVNRLKDYKEMCVAVDPSVRDKNYLIIIRLGQFAPLKELYVKKGRNKASE
ncbi:MAG: hypothetical protein IJ647_08705 [Prevotella sp.]|nr:hypothetical protein [Prevotella sp.]